MLVLILLSSLPCFITDNINWPEQESWVTIEHCGGETQIKVDGEDLGGHLSDAEQYVNGNIGYRVDYDGNGISDAILIYNPEANIIEIEGEDDEIVYCQMFPVIEFRSSSEGTHKIIVDGNLIGSLFTHGSMILSDTMLENTNWRVMYGQNGQLLYLCDDSSSISYTYFLQTYTYKFQYLESVIY